VQHAQRPQVRKVPAATSITLNQRIGLHPPRSPIADISLPKPRHALRQLQNDAGIVGIDRAGWLTHNLYGRIGPHLSQCLPELLWVNAGNSTNLKVRTPPLAGRQTGRRPRSMNGRACKAKWQTTP
jgi:hypothetical protein